jgi:hypothetical protein
MDHVLALAVRQKGGSAMCPRSSKVRWAKRVSADQTCRLYGGDASGMLDEELLDDVGYGVYVCGLACLEVEEAA